MMVALEEGDYVWLSAHLFFGNDLYGAAADEVIKQIAAPVARECLARGWIRRFFFVRYNENGFHIRLRMSGHPDMLESRVKPTLLENIDAAVRRDEKIEQTGAGKRVAFSHLAWIPYSPEVERYGGPDGVHLAEEMFHYSSETAIALLEKIDPQDRSQRLAKGLLAMLVIIHTFCGSRKWAAQFARFYEENYLRAQARDPQGQRLWQEAFRRAHSRQADVLSTYLEASWLALDEGGELTHELDFYQKHLQRMRTSLWELVNTGKLVLHATDPRDWINAVTTIVPSYMHMMNNRLGVSIQEEAYLAVSIHLTIDPQLQEAAR